MQQWKSLSFFNQWAFPRRQRLHPNVFFSRSADHTFLQRFYRAEQWLLLWIYGSSSSFTYFNKSNYRSGLAYSLQDSIFLTNAGLWPFNLGFSISFFGSDTSHHNSLGSSFSLQEAAIAPRSSSQAAITFGSFL